MEKMILIPYSEYLKLIEVKETKEIIKKPIVFPFSNPIQPHQNLFTVRQFAEKHSFITEGALRNSIFFAKTNGMEKVMKRIGRKILIDENAYFEWIEKNNA